MSGGKRGWEGKQLMKKMKEVGKIMTVTGDSSVSHYTATLSHPLHTQPPSGWPRLYQNPRLPIRLATKHT